MIAVGSVLLLVVGVGLNLVQLAELLSRVPPVVQRLGTFESPVHLPIWLNVALGLGAVPAGMERALRLRHFPLLDAAGR